MLENNIPEGELVVSHSFKNIMGSIRLTPFYTNKDTSCVLYNADSLNVMDSIPPNSIDMIFADPPYFLSNGGITCHAGKRVSVNKGDWDKSKGIEETHKFNMEWLKRCQNILTKDGTIWVSGTSHIIFSIGFAMQQLGFKILNDIAWYKINPPPNLSCRYFTHATETVIWSGKNKDSRHYFNYSLMKKMNKDKQMQSLWSITAPKAEEKIYGKHPTQKPIELLERIIWASTREHGIVLDPFTGSSTTGVAAYRIGRYFIGIDNNKEYLELSKKRLEFEQRHKHVVKEEIKKVEHKADTLIRA
ncbi:MAG: DNA methyltransferase [Omnitrophica bacterium RIFCSPLOWO2_01_FULL_45_10]|nr:MAG: DNA methyltransferase [Omnitrophica bacterium RIFCSPLOWO2_01_FULL_45_10]